ncbi:MAG: DUF4178 domain-containing protein [Pirellulaceae bacterium]|nr:DUF4178 domain-containing protein [Pirellulaceae bacterium]
MKTRVANCPACGAPVEFRASSSLVTICEFCHSAVGRGDKLPEDHGKVADVAELISPLMLGMTGKYRDKKFDVVGRVQYSHPSGAMWNEWYLLFPGEVWGWLAEAQGRFYMTFEKRLKSSASIAPFESVQIGTPFELMKSQLTVTEKGAAHVHSAEGEIPWEVRPGAEHRYADLRGDKGLFATLDYSSNPPIIYVGHAVDPDTLQLSGRLDAYGSDTIATTAAHLNCPKCAGSLTLHAPDESLRVTCPNCHALLDCDHGKLSYLITLAHKHIQPLITLSSKGVIHGVEFTVVGFMERYVMYQGTAYSWTEYLLYNNPKGFRWLVNSQGHWSFVETIDYPATMAERSTLSYHGRTFRKYDQGTAFVRSVVGEFPWRVQIGEKVETIDYIAPPYMLSFESSIQIQVNTQPGMNDRLLFPSVASEEVNVSLGSYLSIDDVEKAFGLKPLTRPFSVGPIQPAPEVGAAFIGSHLFFILLIGLMHVGFTSLHPNKAPDFLVTLFAAVLVSIIPILAYLYKYSYEVKRWENSDYSPYAQE